MSEYSRTSFVTTMASLYDDALASGATTRANHRTAQGHVKDSAAWLEDFNPVTAGGTDTYTCSMAATLTSYSNGRFFLVKFTNANTGAATLNVNSLGAIAIKKYGGTALAAGDIGAGQIFLLGYDGTNFQIVGQGNVGDVVGPASSTDNAIATYNGATGKLIKDNSTSTLGSNGTRTTTNTNVLISEQFVHKATASTASSINIGSLANGDAITIIVEVAGKDDSSNTGFGGQYITTWTRSGGTMQLVGETGATISNIDTGGTFTFSSADGGASNVQITGTVGGGTGNASWAMFVRFIQFIA
jgi:hypothetical protein